MGISQGLGSSALLPAGFGFRNLIINGDMRIAQRGTSYNTAVYTVDRWYYGKFGGSATSSSQSTDAPAGFTNSLRITSSYGFASGFSSFSALEQRIEGLNTAFLSYGTANAKQTVLSFWVKSSLSGEHAVCFSNSAQNRKYITTYTVNASNTWEQKFITVPGDMSGTWLTDNTIGLRVLFVAQAGSGERTSTLNQWFTDSSTVVIASTGMVDPLATTGNIFAITGVQLEQNYQATPFEQRPIGVELQLCQRYYEKSYSNTVAPGTNTLKGAVYSSTTSDGFSNGTYTLKFAVEKRAVPDITFYTSGGTIGSWSYVRSGVGDTNSTMNWTSDWSGTTGGLVFGGVGASYTAHRFIGHWVAVSEL